MSGTQKKKKISKAANSQQKTNAEIQKKAAKRAVDKAAKTLKDAVELCEFPKIATDAKIQGAGYDATSGSFVKLKDLSFSSGQLERLIAIAQDGKARVRITIEEINPRFDSAAAKKSGNDPTFEDAPPAGKKSKKKAKAAGKKDGSKLPI